MSYAMADCKSSEHLNSNLKAERFQFNMQNCGTDENNSQYMTKLEILSQSAL